MDRSGKAAKPGPEAQVRTTSRDPAATSRGRAARSSARPGPTSGAEPPPRIPRCASPRIWSASTIFARPTGQRVLRIPNAHKTSNGAIVRVSLDVAVTLARAVSILITEATSHGPPWFGFFAS